MILRSGKIQCQGCGREHSSVLCPPKVVEEAKTVQELGILSQLFCQHQVHMASDEVVQLAPRKGVPRSTASSQALTSPLPTARVHFCCQSCFPHIQVAKGRCCSMRKAVHPSVGQRSFLQDMSGEIAPSPCGFTPLLFPCSAA